MTPITILEHAFSFSRSIENISRETTNFLRRLSFVEEGEIFASCQLSKFTYYCYFINLSDEHEMCRIFTTTFKGIILSWFEFLPARSIHSWKRFA
jgi:hypothetical protein